jgi:hypothetical protein
MKWSRLMRNNLARFGALTLLVLAVAVECFAGESGEVQTGKSHGGFKFAPEFHFNEDLHLFFNQKDSVFRRRYLMEWNSSAELAFFSFQDRFFFFGEMAATVGLGKWPDKAILFDPNDIDIGFGPVLEYRFAAVNIALGLDHHCFHGIDALDYEPVYWNKVALGASSPQFRSEAFRQAIAGTTELSWARRVAWQAGIEYSLQHFFGLDTSVVSWNLPYVLDLACEARCAVARFRGIAAVVAAKSGAYLTRANQTKWNQQLCVELLATQGLFGLDLFVNWVVVDQVEWRGNKDRLVSLGINGFR